MNENRSTAFFLLIVLSVIWGTSFILIKKGLAVFNPVELAAIRISVAGLVLLPLAWVKRMEVQLPEYKNFLFVGLIGIFVPAFLFGVAQTRLDSSLAGALNSLSPVFSIFDSPERISWRARYIAKKVFPVPAEPERTRFELFFFR